MPRPLVTLFVALKTKQNTTIERLHLISTGYFGRQNILHLQIRQQVLVWEKRYLVPTPSKPTSDEMS